MMVVIAMDAFIKGSGAILTLDSTVQGVSSRGAKLVIKMDAFIKGTGEMLTLDRVDAWFSMYALENLLVCRY